FPVRRKLFDSEIRPIQNKDVATVLGPHLRRRLQTSGVQDRCFFEGEFAPHPDRGGLGFRGGRSTEKSRLQFNRFRRAISNEPDRVTQRYEDRCNGEYQKEFFTQSLDHCGYLRKLFLR